MDVINLSGYTEAEKFSIARRYLVPKQLEAARALEVFGSVAISDAAIRVVIREHTREAGVRNLEGQLAALFRKAAREIAEGRARRLTIGDKRVREWLGPRRFAGEVETHRRARGRDRARGHARRR